MTGTLRDVTTPLHHGEEGAEDLWGAGFGKGGRVETNLGPLSWVSGIAIQHDGKIVVAGDGADVNDRVQLFDLVRYTRDGHLDS